MLNSRGTTERLTTNGLSQAFMTLVMIVLAIGAVIIGGVQGRNMAIVAVIVALSLLASATTPQRSR
jgi:hypothetical protein